MAQRGQNRGGSKSGSRISAAAARPWQGAPPGDPRGAGPRRSRAWMARPRTASAGPGSRPPGQGGAPMIWPRPTPGRRSWWPAAGGRSLRMPGAPGQGCPQTELDARAARVTRCPWIQPRAPGPAAAGPGPWCSAWGPRTSRLGVTVKRIRPFSGFLGSSTRQVAQSAAERQRARRARLREQRQAQARQCCACGGPLPQASRGDLVSRLLD